MVDLETNPESTSDGILGDVHRYIVEHREQIARFRIHAKDVVQQRTKEKQEIMKRQADSKRRDHAFTAGDRVFLRKPTSAVGLASLEKRYRGPFTIMQRVGNSHHLNFRIWDNVKAKERIVHASNLIPARLSNKTKQQAYLQLPIDPSRGIPIEKLKETRKIFPWRNTDSYSDKQYESLQFRSKKLPHLMKLWSRLLTLLRFCEKPPANVYDPIEVADLHFADILDEFRSMVYSEDLPTILHRWEQATTLATTDKDLGNHAGLIRHWLKNTREFRLRCPETTTQEKGTSTGALGI